MISVFPPLAASCVNVRVVEAVVVIFSGLIELCTLRPGQESRWVTRHCVSVGVEFSAVRTPTPGNAILLGKS